MSTLSTGGRIVARTTSPGRRYNIGQYLRLFKGNLGNAAATFQYLTKAVADTLYSPISGSYTDEQAQDAVGGILVDSANIGLTYLDAIPSIAALIKIASQAQGDVLYYNGTNWVRLGAGTSGQFLKTNGVAANPAWVT